MKRFLFSLLILTMVLHARTGLAATTEGNTDLLPLGSPMPAFNLTDVVTGQTVSSENFANKEVLMVAFICRHCPYVQHVKKALAQLGRDYADTEAAIVAISSNDADAYADDAPESLKEMAQEEGFDFPFLFDGTQETAKAFTALATPDIFIFDEERKLAYRGQFDDSRPNSGKEATGKDAREFLDALLSGSPLPSQQKAAVGCSIKWKSGNAPAYV